MAETTGVAELVVRVKDEATKQMKQLAKVLQTTLDPDQWDEVKKAMEAMGVEVEELSDDFKKYNKQTDEAAKQTDKTRKKMNKFKDTLDDVGDSADLLGGNMGNVANQASNLLGVLTRVNPLIAGIGVAIGGAGLGVKAASDVGIYAKELDNLSKVGNVTTQELQAFAAGTERVGFDLDKTADILKDVNDRIGDFTSTGGGALQDYFDALGVKVSYTAQELQNMSTLEAITSIQRDLDANNVPLERQIFLWESLSGESAKMIPLIKNNAEAMKEFAREAEERGEIFTTKEIQDAKAFEKTLSDFGKSLTTLWRRIGIAVIPLLESFTETITEVSEAINSINKALRDGLDDWDSWNKVITNTYDILAKFSPTAVAVDKVRDAVLGVEEASKGVGGANLDKMKASYKSAEQTLTSIKSKLVDMQEAETLLKDRIENSNLSRAKLAQLQDNLVETQAVIADLASQEKIATEGVLKSKIALEAAQRKYNDAQKDGSNFQEGVDAVNSAQGGNNGQVLQEMLDDYKAQLLTFYQDTGKTLESRLSAAADATYLNYKSVLTRLKTMGGETGVVEAIINQEAARAQFDILSTEFDRVSEDIEIRAAKVGRQVATGILSESQGYEQLQKIYGEAGGSMDSLLASMEALATQTGSQELAQQVESLRASTEAFKDSLGDEGFVKPEWVNNLEEARLKIQELKASLVADDLSSDNLEAAMQVAVDNAKKPLEDLKKYINETLTGDELIEGTIEIDKAIDIAAVEAKMGVLEDLFASKVGLFNTMLESIQLSEDSGLITEAEAAEQVRLAYAATRPEILAVQEQLQALAEETGSPELIRRAQEMENSFRKLDATVEETTATMIDNMLEAGAEAAGSGLAQAITDIAMEAESLGDVFDNVMKGILQSMLQVVQSAVAKQFMNSIMGAIGGGGGIGGAIAGGATQAFATGGYVRGAGTTTSDSIRALLSDKEFVQPADATAYYGVQFMEMLRRRAIPREMLTALMGNRSMPVHKPRTPRFSSGGFVSGNVLSQPDGGVQGSDMSVTLVQVKNEDEAKAYVQSRQGQGDIIKVLQDNKTKVKNILG